MGKLLDGLQPAVKKETRNIFIYTLIGDVLMIAAFFVLHKWFYPDNVPFDYTIFTGALGGLLIATLNFLLMGITVQKVAAEEDEKTARQLMKTSYSRRLLLQIAWIAVSLATPVIFWAAGILPLIFPSFGIKIKGILERKKYIIQEVEQKQDGC
ncbi:MAG: ATP synthase subunit I [Lachnospiraceae bacterium]|nr:ATP synthase subunit I [Lachnospiraceae bacterium]